MKSSAILGWRMPGAIFGEVPLTLGTVAKLNYQGVTGLAHILLLETGNTSMEIGVKVLAESIRDQVIRHANSCFLTMVAVDDSGRTTPVPPLEPKTPDEIRRYRAAQLRRELRKEFETRQKQLHTGSST